MGSLVHGDCVEVMRSMPEASVDAVVTDPPYGIRMMGLAWDAPGIENGTAKNENNNMRLESFARSRVKGGSSGFGTRSAYAGEYDRSTAANRAYQEWCEQWARECLRILKPGGYLLASGGTRTYHRLACAIEDAGFEIRDSIQWIYGSGFPKSLNVSKAIDKMAGAKREVLEVGLTVRRIRPGADQNKDGSWEKLTDRTYTHTVTASATEAAKQWEGFGTALKPAHEPIVVARKPLSEKSVARQVLSTGTGALNIDASRISTSENLNGGAYSGELRNREERTSTDSASGAVPLSRLNRGAGEYQQSSGRWPANVILSHSPECQRVGVKRVRGSLSASGPTLTGESTSVALGKFNGVEGTPNYTDPDGFEEVEAWECVEGCPVAELDRQSGTLKSGGGDKGNKRVGSQGYGSNTRAWSKEQEPSEGGASRFFKTFEREPGFRYVAKASRSERNAFTKSLPRTKNLRKRYQQDKSGRWLKRVACDHPTVKPLALMRYLVKLVTPPGGVVLDPFAGSATTLVAAILEGFSSVGIEREAEYVLIGDRRIAHAQNGGFAEPEPKPVRKPQSKPKPALVEVSPETQLSLGLGE